MMWCSGEATEAGEYHFCFDNTFSHISSKTVFFRITATEVLTTLADMDFAADAQELLPFEVTVENFKVLKSYFHPEIPMWAIYVI